MRCTTSQQEVSTTFIEISAQSAKNLERKMCFNGDLEFEIYLKPYFFREILSYTGLIF